MSVPSTPSTTQPIAQSTDRSTPLQQNTYSASSPAFPLAMASVGERLAITHVKGAEGTVRRLSAMGLVRGINVHLISNEGGAIIVAIADCRIGLGISMAQKILCTPA